MASLPIGDNFSRMRLLQAMKAGYIQPEHVPGLDAPPGAALAAYQSLVPFLHAQSRQGFQLGIPGLLRTGLLQAGSGYGGAVGPGGSTVPTPPTLPAPGLPPGHGVPVGRPPGGTFPKPNPN